MDTESPNLGNTKIICPIRIKISWKIGRWTTTRCGRFWWPIIRQLPVRIEVLSPDWNVIDNECGEKILPLIEVQSQKHRNNLCYWTLSGKNSSPKIIFVSYQLRNVFRGSSNSWLSCNALICNLAKHTVAKVSFVFKVKELTKWVLLFCG